MRSNNLLYTRFLSELEGLDPECLTTEEAMESEDYEIVAEVLAEAASEVFLERLEELFNTIEMEFTTTREDLQ